MSNKKADAEQETAITETIESLDAHILLFKKIRTKKLPVDANGNVVKKGSGWEEYENRPTAEEAINHWIATGEHPRTHSDPTLADYCSHLFEQGKAPSTIALAVAAIKRYCKGIHITPDWTLTSETLAGIRRAGKERGRGQSKPLTYEHFVLLMHSTTRKARYRVLDRAIIALLFMAGMRRSEVANLCWNDVREGKDETLSISITSSKTNQEGDTADFRLLKGIGAGALRELWKTQYGTQPFGDLGTGRPRVIGIGAQQIGNWFRACCQAEGLSGQLTSHSGRIGLATELVSRGASTGEVALAGGWKSERMVLHYSSQQRAEQSAVAKYL